MELLLSKLGKRVNYSLSNAYLYLSNAAVVEFNTQTALSKFYNTKFQKGPSYLAKKIEVKRLQKSRREKERRNLLKKNKVYRKCFKSIKDNGAGYGENCQTTDLTPENLENEKEVFKIKLVENQKNRLYIEERPRMATDSGNCAGIIEFWEYLQGENIGRSSAENYQIHVC